MKALLVGEYRENKLLEMTYELLAFADLLGAEKAMFLVGKEAQAPRFNGKLYLADAEQCGEYNPDLHKRLIQAVVEKEDPDYVVLLHSSYGWDLAPRLAAALRVAQVSEIVNVVDGKFELTLCNAKLRRAVRAASGKAVLTIQSGAFSSQTAPTGSPQIEKIEPAVETSGIEFVGYEAAEKKEVDLTRAEVIVSVGRGVGKKENVSLIANLAAALGGELGASRPVVDAGWVDHSRQVGTTGQTVSPKLYVACGISGAMQHLAGMKKSNFIVAINKDKEAPVAAVADVMVVADVLEFAPALINSLKKS
jgi:electron transfer flavoprotein alpha subunit